jgi:hypothetical protein
MIGRVSAIVSCKASVGYVWRARQKQLLEKARTAGENVKALRGQAKNHGRNPVFVDSHNRKTGQDLWNKAVNRFVKTRALASLDEATMEVARLFVNVVKEHIFENRDKSGGGMRPVSQMVQKQKEREMVPQGVAKQTLTPLRWTGQLLGSIIPRARRG